MPQTKRGTVINSRSSKLECQSFVFNKIDRPAANPDKLREELSQMDILVEEWGGKSKVRGFS